MGEVWLGMPGQWAKDYREKADHYTYKIGGLPDWPVSDMQIRAELLQCRLCGGRLCLVAQVYAPISVPKLNLEERVIYILGCLKPECGSDARSWRALRAQKCSSDKQIPTSSSEGMLLEEDSAPVSTTSSWLAGGLSLNECLELDNESDNDAGLEELTRALVEASTIASQSKKQHGSKYSAKHSGGKQRVEDRAVPVLPCFYICCEKEQLSSDVGAISAGCSSLSIKENGNMASDSESEEKWEVEAYEYDRAPGADRTFLKFKKRLDTYRHQCFRYSYGGNPLLAATNLVEPGNCNVCGSSCNYELQLMPPLSYFLREAADSLSGCPPDGWCWMTLIVYTCSKSCCPSSCCERSDGCCWAVAEEAIVIQNE